jgi:hypothetical protein
MIAPSAQRRRGYGRAALLAFMIYLERHMHDLAAEYHSASTPASPNPTLTPPYRKPALQLRAKIASSNAQSLALFRGVGFVPLRGGKENYFGEVELMFPPLVGDGVVSEAWADEILGGRGAFSRPAEGAGLGYREVVYCRG